MDFPLLVRDPDKKARSLVKKLTHSGEADLDKQDLVELKEICKLSKDGLMVIVFRECMKCLRKEHSQVRVSTVKLLDYLFQKSHVIREKLLDDFDTFLELTLAISQTPKIKLKLPPPKKFSALLQEITAKLIHSWHSEFGFGYEKLRYIHRFLNEHKLVDFSHFRVQTHEDLIKRQKLAEKQEKILTLSIENRMKEFRLIKPEVEQLIAQIDSLIDLLAPTSQSLLQDDNARESTSIDTDASLDRSFQQNHGIANLSQSVHIEFSPYLEVQRNQDNKEIVQNLKELKQQLAESKMTKLICIEKTLSKRGEQFVNTLREIIDLKNKSMNTVLKLSELKIIDDSVDGNKRSATTLDNANSDSDEESELEEVEPKEGLETYIPKSMRYEYGLEAIDPREQDSSGRINLTDESFDANDSLQASYSGSIAPPQVVMSCNVRLESGKLCPRRDKVKCPFHGKIIPRDHKGVPVDEKDRLAEEKRLKSSEADLPEWQDPQLLLEIKAATGVDLTMPVKGKSKTSPPKRKLANTKTCDLTPKQRLKKRLKLLNK